MSKILIAGYSQLSVPLMNSARIQDPKLTFGIRRNVEVGARVGSLLVDVLSKIKPQRVEYYKWVATKLAEEGRFSEFASLILTMREAGTDVTNFVQQLEMEVVRAGFARGIKNGELHSVLETLTGLHRAGCHSPKFLDDHGIRFIANHCRKLVEKGNVKECIRLLRILSDCHFSIKDFVEPMFIIQQCIKLKNVRMALRYVDLHSPPNVWFNFLMRELEKQAGLNSALLPFKRSQSAAMTADMYTYRDMIDAFGLCGKPERAIIIFKELLDQKVTPNVFVYNSIMNVNAGNLNYVLQIYRHMQNSGVTADMTTYNILLKTLSMAGKVDMAERLYREILHREAAGELKMDVIAYSTMIQVFGKANMWALAMEVKRDMIAAGIIPDVVTWTSLIGACANAGLVEKAIQIFDEMVVSGCEPNTQCCNTLLHACVKSCQYARAFHLFNSWKKNGLYAEISLNSENLLTENNDHRKQALNPVIYNGTYKRSEFKPTVVTYNILMKASGSAPFLIKSLMEEMDMIGLVPDCVSWSILIDAYGKVNDLSGALQTFRKMREIGIRPDSITYTTVIKACVQNKCPEKAFLMFEKMKKSRLQPNLVTFNTLLRARRNYGNLAEVLQSLAIYEEMRTAGYAPDDNLLKGLLEEWAEGVIQHNNYRNLDRLPKENVIPEEMEDRQVISYSGLFQKVATHAQPDNINNLIRVDRLTKTEARIAVLAVLRILKERHGIGIPIKDDLTIITEVDDTHGSRHDAIVKVLKDELGFVVSNHKDDLNAKGYIPFEDESCRATSNQRFGNRISSHQDSNVNVNASSQSGNPGIAIRRPPNLGWLRISSKSLNEWLRKKRKPAKDMTEHPPSSSILKSEQN